VRADELRALQAPLKDRYRREPAAALVTLRADAELDAAAVSCRVDTGEALVRAGLHPATGGTGQLACSGDLLLQALVACAGVTLRAVATALEVPVGFREIRLRFELDSDAGPEQLERLLTLTERYCVVLQTLRTPPTLSVTQAAAGSGPMA
jgi:uncharacterized OsmC-like protein